MNNTRMNTHDKIGLGIAAWFIFVLLSPLGVMGVSAVVVWHFIAKFW